MTGGWPGGEGPLREQLAGLVGAKEEPAAGDPFVLHVLAQQAGVALAKAHLHGREREQPRDLGAANLALRRSM